MILATTPAPTVRPPSRIAKRRPSSIAIGAISFTVIYTLSPGITISLSFRQLDRARHVRRTEVELRTVALEERRMTTAFFLRQHVHFSLEVRVRRDRARLGQHLAALHVFTLRAAQQNTHVVARLTLVQQLAEHFHARARSSSRVARIPTISISSPTLTTPRSIRPVTTVPRPEIENTSSTGIRNGLSTARSGVGM